MLILSQEGALLNFWMNMWKKGPGFLSRPVNNWPMKSASEVTANARQAVNKFQRKTFLAVLTRARVKTLPNSHNPSSEGAAVTNEGNGALNSPGEGEKTASAKARTETLSGTTLIDQVDQNDTVL